MEKAYKTVLEIILNLCEKEEYRKTSDIKMMCETVLKQNEYDVRTLLNNSSSVSTCSTKRGSENVHS